MTNEHRLDITRSAIINNFIFYKLFIPRNITCCFVDVNWLQQLDHLENLSCFIIFNESIPQNLGFVDRSKEGHELDLEWTFKLKDETKKTVDSNDDIIQNKVGKKQLGKIIDRCIAIMGTSDSSIVLDKIKATGFKYSTQGAITVAVFDLFQMAVVA